VDGSFKAVETGLRSEEVARVEAARIAGELQADLERLEQDALTGGPAAEAAGRARSVANRAVAAMHFVQTKLTDGA
jgi:hypothetical protein